MALTITELARIDSGGKAVRIHQITSDGSTTTIDASDLALNYINGVVSASKANLAGTLSIDAFGLAAAAEETNDVTVTGAVLGDLCVGAIDLDVTDLMTDVQITATDTATLVISNVTAASVDIATTTANVSVFKDIGFSTQSGAYIIFGPTLASGDTFIIQTVGY